MPKFSWELIHDKYERLYGLERGLHFMKAALASIPLRPNKTEQERKNALVSGIEILEGRLLKQSLGSRLEDQAIQHARKDTDHGGSIGEDD